MADTPAEPAAAEDALSALFPYMEPEEATQKDEEEATLGKAPEGDESQDEASEADESDTAKDEGQGKEDQDEDYEELFIDLDDEEVPLSKLREWKKSGLRQDDYTRKTQALADERRAFESQTKEVESLRTTLAEGVAKLKALLDEGDTLNMEELRLDDPDKYLEVKQARKEATEKYLKELSQPKAPEKKTVDFEAEGKKLLELTGWTVKDGDFDDAAKKDRALLVDWFGKNGFSNEEVEGIQHAHVMAAFVKAARYDALKNANPNRKKVVPKSVKGRSKPKTGQTDSSALDLFITK